MISITTGTTEDITRLNFANDALAAATDIVIAKFELTQAEAAYVAATNAYAIQLAGLEKSLEAAVASVSP